MTVSFVVPVRNEEEHLLSCLESLVGQDYPADKMEILVVDGRSSDRTREMVQQVSVEHPNVYCLDNPAGIVPSAMNIGIRAAHGHVIIRADGHNTYPRDYAANCVKYLEQTGADNVGGPCGTVAADRTFGAKLVAAVLSSPFGVGNSKFRTTCKEGFVDTVPFGAFRRELFDRVGFYNEKLVRNQDNELNARIRQAGGKIYLTPALTTCYHPVKTFAGLLRYAFKTSRWHIFTLRENQGSMSLRHLAPAVFLLLILLGLVVRPWSASAPLLVTGLVSAYLLTGYLLELRRHTADGAAQLLIFPFAAFCFHIAYGLGTLAGLIYLVRQPSPSPIRPGASIEEPAK